MSSEDLSIEEYSGIEQPPFLEQIKRILDEYRNDAQIIKELIQNADDAEATCMKILYEGRTINTEQENEAECRKFLRAPALVFFNDKTFTAGDWRGIRSIYTSIKKDDPLKIGRFGLGFKSVFHLTDFPCIISGETAMFINPHATESGKICLSVKLKGLKDWPRLHNEDFIDSLYGTFGFSEDTLSTGIYNGTMFWFPLRQSPSPLSDNTYHEGNVLNLLKAFITESEKCILFLKTLCSVNVYVNMPSAEASCEEDMSQLCGASKALSDVSFGKETCYFLAEVRNISDDLLQKRQYFLKEIEAIGKAVPDESKHWVFDISVKTELKSMKEETKVAKSRWLIVNYLKGGEISEKLGQLLNDDDLGYPHLVGLAAPIDQKCNYSSTSGHVFCYQPLPQENKHMTGLPVHINGFFALSQNRRHVSWPDQGDASNGQGDKKIEWNIVLKTQVIPEAYGRLIIELVKLSKQEGNPEYLLQAVYSAVPDLLVVDEHWSDLSEAVPEICKTLPIVYTKQGNGKWLKAQEAVCTNFKQCIQQNKTDQNDDFHISLSNRHIETVYELLLSDGVNVVETPDHLADAFGITDVSLTYAAPAYLKLHMESHDTYKTMELKKKQDIFEYVMLDFSRQGLERLELLPIEDGTYSTFSPGREIILEKQDIIRRFPGQESCFVRADLRQSTVLCLSHLAESGAFCLTRLTGESASRMVKSILGKTFDIQDTIYIGSSNLEEWKPWIRSMWDLIQNRLKDSIGQFSNIPIFPKMSSADWDQDLEISLLRLERPIVHLPSLSQHEDKEHIYTSFEHLSVSVIEHIPQDIDDSLVCKYLHDETSESTTSLLDRLKLNDVEVFNKKSNDERSAAILKFFCERIHTKMGKTCSYNLRELKLFRGHKAVNDSELVSLNQTLDVCDGTEIPIPFPLRLILLNSDAEKKIAIQLGANVLSEPELVRITLRKINDYTYVERYRFIHWLITNGEHFKYHDVQESLKDISFLEAGNGAYYKANELFDPSDQLLSDLFKGEHVFPNTFNKNEQNNQFNNGLRLLGLKTQEKLTSADIERVGCIVHDMAEKKEVDIAKCVALLEVMNRHSEILPYGLYNKRCVFIEDNFEDNLYRNIPLKNRQCQTDVLICMPSEIMSVRYVNLVGSVMYLINCKRFEALSNTFKWDKTPNVQNVVQHLFNIVQNYHPQHKATYLPIVTSVYEWLSTQTESNAAEVKDALQQQFTKPFDNFVWDGNCFQPIENMYAEVKKGDVDLKPFLHPLPSEIQNLSDFFICLGCQKSIDFNTYVDALHRIKSSEESMSGDASLTETFTDMSIAILNKIKKNYLDEFGESGKQLLFPTLKENGCIQMMPAQSCTFCDEPWLKNMDFQFEDDISYVHPELPIKTAESLGVPSLRQQMMSDTEAFAEWGQEEPLTRRLRNLLKEGYVDGFSVAKELFQNADDAGAEKLWILFDERENNDAKTKLISKEMADCQGPALWIYNDARFTESDLKNITKLSGATKEDDSTKIGKFGLGFCSVYNITDVPSFISGENIVIFDPDMSHIGKVVQGRSPGLRINFKKLSNLKMLRSLNNQFQPFEGIFGCKIKDSSAPFYDGTLFRLPLRNKASDICDVVYTSSEVKSLFDKIMSMAANMFLFNQNVSEMKLMHIPKAERNPSNANLLFEITKGTKRMHALDLGSSIASSMLAEASKRKLEKRMHKEPVQVIDKVSVHLSMYVDSKFNTRSNSISANEDWLISWSTGKDKGSIDLAYEDKGALPLGAVAIPIKMTASSSSLEVVPIESVAEQFYQKGHLFLFLPLPIQHRFPFHINSQFNVTTDRRHLKTANEDDKNVKMKKWNQYLLEDSVTHALLYLLENIHLFGSLKGYQFDNLWPRQETAEELEHIPKAFYRYVATSELYKVFEKDGQWFDISRCVFIEKVFRSSTVGDIVFEVLSMLTDFVVDVSVDVYDMLFSANPTLIKEKTVSEERFYLQYFLPNLEELSADSLRKKQRKELLLYAVSIQNESIDTWLKGNSCIPSQPCGCLKRPDELIDTDSILAALFVASDGYFPELPFTDGQYLAKLRKLGIMHEVLTDCLVRDRASSIEMLNRKCLICAALRSGYILAYLSENILNHNSAISELQNIKFLPVLSKPKDWIFEWHSEMFASQKGKKKCKIHKTSNGSCNVSHFDRPEAIYYTDCKNIVGCIAFVLDNSTFTRNELNSRRCKEMLEQIGIKGLEKRNVDIKFILQQLECVSTTYGDVAKDKNKFQVTFILQDIYRYLDKACISTDASDYIMKETKDKAIVFVSETFVFLKQVASNCFYDCKPHLFELKDSALGNCKTLCKCLNVSDYFKPHEIALLLQDIKNKKQDSPLSGTEVHTLINILYCLQHSMKALHDARLDVQSIVNEQIKAIYGPDENGFLRDCTTMCFNDYDDLEKSETMIYAHKSFPADLAKFFGVNPKLIHCLEESSEDFGEDFFQDEPLVVRLHSLVEGYPCDSGIFKELIQNADDAKATEIHFIKDYTTHPKSNIFDDRFGALQGPALVVFNDSAFSNEDLKGIQSLGLGNKSDDPSKTGRYGVGFNAVYNLTDAPSFYTKGGDIENGETLCVFDPLANYIPKVTRKKPGKRYRDVSYIRKVHGDIMSGYHEEKLMQGKRGTIFRFPLRTADMAQTSEIKNESVGMNVISDLLHEFSGDLCNVLLFLKHLKTVKISTCQGKCFVQEFCINVKMDKDESEKREDFVRKQKQLCDEFERNKDALFKFEQHKAIYRLSMNEQSVYSHSVFDYIVVQVLGFNPNAKLNTIVKENLLSRKLGLLPHVGIALRVEKTKHLDMQLNSNTVCKAFCFLPLPILTGLPVHVHGYFALDHETRRTLWYSEKRESCYKTLWNYLLIEHISSAYVSLLKYAKSLQFQVLTDQDVTFSTVRQALENYEKLFPLKDKVSDQYWKHLLKSFYKQLVEEHVDFLPVQNILPNLHDQSPIKKVRLTWTPLNVKGSPFPAYISEESTGTENDVSKLNRILRRIGLRIAYVSDPIKETITISDINISYLDPKSVITFLCSNKSESSQRECNIQTGKNIANTTLQSVNDAGDILCYCLKDSQTLKSNFCSIPLMVTDDCFVRTVSEVDFLLLETVDKFCKFFPTERQKFLHSYIAIVLTKHVIGNNDISQGKVKRFNLSEFVSLVKKTNIIDHTCTSIRPWDRMKPPEEWVRLFWSFFSYQISGEETVNKQLQIVRHLPIIPIEKSVAGGMYLAPPVISKLLINLSSFGTNTVLHSALQSMDLPLVSESAISEIKGSRSFVLLMSHVSNYDTPKDVLMCLNHNLCDKTDLGLAYKKAKAILQYFNDALNENTPQNAFKELKNIPLFISHFGQMVALKNFIKIFVVPSSLPKDGLKDLAEKANVLFLPDFGCKELFKHLSITELALFEVYTSYILPHQQLMSRECFYGHLDFLSRRIYDERTENTIALLSKLKQTPFVEMADGKRVRACELFDPEHDIFKRMCKESELVPDLVPDSLKRSNILKLFRKIGLKKEMTIQLFERFAENIATKCHTAELSDDERDNSKELVTHLLNRSDRFFENESFENLAKIRFILPHTVNDILSLIRPQFNCETLICFEDSLLEYEENISWTVANILPIYASQNMIQIKMSEIVKKKLKIHDIPELKDFERHCRLVGVSIHKALEKMDAESRKTVNDITIDLYNALATFPEDDQITTVTIRSLASVPLIYYESKKIILPANRVVLSCKMDQQIPPFLMKCPKALSNYTNVFLRLGASEEPSCESFATVLNALKGESEENELLPNELANAKKAMGLFFKYLDEERDEVKLSCKKLFLLSENKTLEDSRMLIVPNNSYLMKRLTLNCNANCLFIFEFDRLKKNRLKPEDCIENLKKLSPTLRPHLLDEVVKEKIVLENIRKRGREISTSLEKFIHSRDFLFGFLRLFRHAIEFENKTWNQTEEPNIARSLQTVQFQQCSGIETMLFIKRIENGQLGNEIRLEDTNEDRYIHIELDNDGACVYFDTSVARWKQNLTEKLVIYLNGLVNKCFKDENIFILKEIAGMFEMPKEVDMYLSQKGVKEYTFQPTLLDESPTFPVPGEFVEKKFHTYLDNDYGIIHEYDYKFIALEVDDPAFDQEEEEQEEKEGNEEDNGKGSEEFSENVSEPTYKYVHIIRQIGPDAELPMFQEYEIDCGSDTHLTVKAYQLYKFVRKRKADKTEKTDVVIYARKTGVPQSEHPKLEKTAPSLKEVFSEIRKYLREAWKKEEHEKKKIIKRLYLKWHPDKNKDNVPFCTIVFQYLQKCLRRLENGLELEDEDEEDSEGGVNRNRGNSNSSGSYFGSSGNFGNTRYDRYWRRYDRGRRYNERRYNHDSYNFYDSWRYKSSYRQPEYEPYHWYSRARLWIRLAEDDLRQAKVLMQHPGQTHFNWSCYIAHQAAEKALKAAWYANDAKKINRVTSSHNLDYIAGGLETLVQTAAHRLTEMTGDYKAMRYPSDLHGDRLPSEAYSKTTATCMIEATEQLLSLVRNSYIK